MFADRLRIKDDKEIVYTYVLTTLRNDKGNFVQTGSAPNFQGGFDYPLHM